MPEIIFKKNHSRCSSRYQRSFQVGRKSSSIDQSRNGPTSPCTLNDSDEGNFKKSHEEDNNILEGSSVFRENDKEIQNILSEVMTK